MKHPADTPKQTQFKPKTKPFFVPKTPIKPKTNPIQTQTNPIPVAHAIASPNAGYATHNRLLNYKIQQGKEI
ncbi:MAG: hypothetical protein MUO22_00570 [Sedimentisphaerales bacterium]|nr:hypothetical protein [Sedimentisphaerales bacterium]